MLVGGLRAEGRLCLQSRFTYLGKSMSTVASPELTEFHATYSTILYYFPCLSYRNTSVVTVVVLSLAE
jgi:hypothetical protein